MSRSKGAMTKAEMIELRKQGKTLREIAEVAGLSTQRISQIMRAHRVRKVDTDIEKVRYKGFYDFLIDNPNVSFERLANVAHVCAGTHESSLFREKLVGRTDKCKFTIGQIKRLIKFTGKSFEELFEIREVK